MPASTSRSPSRLQRLVYALRTEGASRPREAWAVGLGLFIGCSPLIGFHLSMCVAAGWLFGLNRLKLYLAANLVNPLVLPAVLFWEVQTGSLLRRGDLYPLTLAAFRALDPWQFGADLAIGSAVVGGLVGLAAGLLTYLSLGRRFEDEPFATLVRTAADRYQGAGITAWEFARAKLRRDPIYRAALTSGLLPPEGRLVDVGCGQGLFLALVAEARAAARTGAWPPAWPAGPAGLELAGIELRPRIAAIARHALGADATIVTGDALGLDVESADAVAVFDVLHLLDRPRQEALAGRLARVLRPGGVLLVREADASAGWRFQMVRLGNRLTALSQRRWRGTLAFRTADEWRALLAAQGLEVTLQPMGDRTPFANVLLVARRL